MAPGGDKASLSSKKGRDNLSFFCRKRAELIDFCRTIFLVSIRMPC